MHPKSSHIFIHASFEHLPAMLSLAGRVRWLGCRVKCRGTPRALTESSVYQVPCFAHFALQVLCDVDVWQAALHLRQSRLDHIGSWYSCSCCVAFQPPLQPSALCQDRQDRQEQESPQWSQAVDCCVARVLMVQWYCSDCTEYIYIHLESS